MTTILRARRAAFVFINCVLAMCLLAQTAEAQPAAPVEATGVSQGFVGSVDSYLRRTAAAAPVVVDASNMIIAMAPISSPASADVDVAVTPVSEVPPAPPLALPDPTPTPAPAEVVVAVGPVSEVPPAPPLAVPDPTPTPAPAGESASIGRGRAALRVVGFDPGALGYTISFHPYSGNHRGLTFTQRRHIEIYVRSSMSDAELAYVIAHELGHAVDHVRNTNDDRARWRAARGMAPDLGWWPNHLASDYASPSGDFAECFATWRIGSASHSSWGGCAPVLGLMAELATS